MLPIAPHRASDGALSELQLAENQASAISEAELAETGLTLPESRLRSFAKILAGRRG